MGISNEQLRTKSGMFPPMTSSSSFSLLLLCTFSFSVPRLTVVYKIIFHFSCILKSIILGKQNRVEQDKEVSINEFGV